MRESRIVLPPNAGVAELADALDSKSAVKLRSNAAIAVLLPNQRILVAPQDRARMQIDQRIAWRSI